MALALLNVSCQRAERRAPEVVVNHLNMSFGATAGSEEPMRLESSAWTLRFAQDDISKVR